MSVLSPHILPYPDFFQDPVRIGNQFVEDTFLQAVVLRHMGQKTFDQVKDDLTKFGARCQTDLMDLAAQMELQQPYLTQYDSWGSRVDQLWTCPQWRAQHVVSAEEGLIAHGYTREYGANNRIFQFAKLHMYTPSSGMYNCPLAMTDGAARLCELLLDPNSKLSSVKGGLDPVSRPHVEEAQRHLLSRDGKKFWTSGQWMTEKGGGSDVADGTRTVARKQADGSYKLFGFKWFTSATDAEMTITLARIEDDSGRTTPGSKGLTCFMMRVKKDDGLLNNIRIHKMKNKLGTKQLPTAELELAGSVAYRLSDPGSGVSLITTLVNVTRLYNSVAACGFMRRMMALMRDYQHRRHVFGHSLANTPMHIETIAEAEVQYRAATAFTFDVAARLGRVEQAETNNEQDQALLRLLTPLVKLYTAKQCVSLVSEGLESFGGQGYIEDSKLPRLLRDAQVLPIWEGTTNVLSHDLLRVFARTGGEGWNTFKKEVQGRIQQLESFSANEATAMKEMKFDRRLARVIAAWSASLAELDAFVTTCLKGGQSGVHAMEQQARALAFGMSRVYIASTLAVHASWSKQYVDLVVLERWVLDGDTRQSTAASPLVPNSIKQAVLSSSPLSKLRYSDSRLLSLDCDPVTGEARGNGNVNKHDGSIRSKL